MNGLLRLSRTVQRLVRTGARPDPTISRGERELLKRAVAEEEADASEQLTQGTTGGGWWLGSDQVSGKVCWRLIRHALISTDGEESGGIQYWRVNETGRRVASDPTYIPPMIRMLHGEKGPFFE